MSLFCRPHFSFRTFIFMSAFTAATLQSLPSHAQSEVNLPGITVTADRFGIEAEKLGSSNTVVTAEQLENSGAVYVQDALRLVPGLAVNRSGSFGSQTQVRIRGAEGNHVIVVVDGIEVNNPVEGEFDFSSLLVENIERIEVLRGPQSAAWGSNALAGVINIVTKRAEKGVKLVAKAEDGSFDTNLLSGGLYAGSEWGRAAINLTRLQTNGINISNFGDERDGEQNTTFSFKGDIDITPYLNVEGVIRHTERETEFDAQDFAFPVTPTQGLVIDTDNDTRSKELFARAQATLSLFDDRWTQKVFVTHGDTERDQFSDGVVDSGNKGERITYGYQSRLTFETPQFANARHTFIGLIEEEKERFRNTSPTATFDQAQWFERTLKGRVGEYRLELLDRIFLTGAYRYDENDSFADAETYRATAALKIPETRTRFHASIGKGVTNPTFFEQFGFTPATFDGNPNLVPESSESWDVGVEQSFFKDRLKVDVTYFKADLQDEIVTTFDTTTFRLSVDNLDDKSEREGVEVTVVARPTDNLDIVGSYTHTDSFQIRDGIKQKEVRRPEHMASLDVTYRFFDNRARIGAGVSYNGEMDDLEFISATPQSVVTLDDYTLVRLSGSYDISENVRWFGRVENLLDEDYEEVFSFNSPGIAAYTGVRIRFGD